MATILLDADALSKASLQVGGAAGATDALGKSVAALSTAGLPPAVAGSVQAELGAIGRGLQAAARDVAGEATGLAARARWARIGDQQGVLLGGLGALAGIFAGQFQVALATPRAMPKVSTSSAAKWVKRLERGGLGASLFLPGLGQVLADAHHPELSGRQKWRRVVHVTATEAAPGTGLAVGGAVAGRALGTALGAFGGPAGAFVGSSLGGILGGVVGKELGKHKWARDASGWAADRLADGAGMVADGANAVAKGADDVVDFVGGIF